MNVFPKKVIPFFEDFSSIFSGREGKFHHSPSPQPKKDPIALEVDVCPAAIIQTAMGL